MQKIFIGKSDYKRSNVGILLILIVGTILAVLGNPPSSLVPIVSAYTPTPTLIFDSSTHCIVLGPAGGNGVDVRGGPSSRNIPHSTIPVGTIVTPLEKADHYNGDWIRIRRGWVREATISCDPKLLSDIPTLSW